MKKFMTMLIIFICLVCTSCMPMKMTAIDSSKDVIISVNKKVGSLTFLDRNDLHKITDWNLNRDVSGAVLLHNGKEIAVYHPLVSKVDIYQLSNGNKINSWKAEKGITNMISLEDKKMVVITNGEKNTITFYNNQGKIVKTLKIGKNPISMVQDKIHNKLFVSLFNERKVIGINLTTFKIEQTIEVPMTSMGLQLNDDATELFVGGHGNGEEENEDVKVYSTATGNLLKSLHTPLMPISFFENEDGLFTIAHGTNQIYKLHPDSSKQNELIEIGSNPYSAIGTNHEAYVASYDLNKLYQIDTTKMKIEKEAAVGRGPFQLLLREGNRNE